MPMRDEDGEESGIRIEARDGTRAGVVPALGGVISSLVFPTDAGPRETLFRHAHFWEPANPATRGGIPLLFPACGRVRLNGEPRYALGGASYPLAIHGFAMRRPWAVVDRSDGALSMESVSDGATRAAYPFDFRLRYTCRVAPGALLLEFAVSNPGDASMPFGAGWHPFFAAPGIPEKTRMAVDVPAVASGRYDDTYTRIAQWNAPLPFPLRPDHPLFRDTLHQAGPGTVRVSWPDGFTLALDAKIGGGVPLPFWQLHTDPDRPFVCVEPWTSPPNALNSGEHLLRLAPGDTWTMSLEIRCEPRR